MADRAKSELSGRCGAGSGTLITLGRVLRARLGLGLAALLPVSYVALEVCWRKALPAHGTFVQTLVNSKCVVENMYIISLDSNQTYLESTSLCRSLQKSTPSANPTLVSFHNSNLDNFRV